MLVTTKPSNHFASFTVVFVSKWERFHKSSLLPQKVIVQRLSHVTLIYCGNMRGILQVKTGRVVKRDEKIAWLAKWHRVLTSYGG